MNIIDRLLQAAIKRHKKVEIYLPHGKKCWEECYTFDGDFHVLHYQLKPSHFIGVSSKSIAMMPNGKILQDDEEIALEAKREFILDQIKDLEENDGN